MSGIRVFDYDGPAVRAQRERVQQLCNAKGIAVSRKGNAGAWRLTGVGMDLIVSDLAWARPEDFPGAQRGNPRA